MCGQSIPEAGAGKLRMYLRRSPRGHAKTMASASFQPDAPAPREMRARGLGGHTPLSRAATHAIRFASGAWNDWRTHMAAGLAVVGLAAYVKLSTNGSEFWNVH
jgi:hypothetical protein